MLERAVATVSLYKACVAMESVAQGLVEDFATMESFVNETQWWDTVLCHAKMNNKSSGIVAEKKLLASPKNDAHDVSHDTVADDSNGFWNACLMRSSTK